MKRFPLSFLVLGLCCSVFLGCRLLGDFDDGGPQPSAQPSLGDVLGFTPEEQARMIDTALSEQAFMALPMTAPAVSFYRFDLRNEKGARRLATVISYADALATPTYGPESTARVYMYEAKKSQAGYEFDYFPFAAGLNDAAVNRVVQAMLPYYGDRRSC